MNSQMLTKLKSTCDLRGLKVAAAESVTVGRIQSTLGSVTGSSTFFRGGVTAYDIDQKVEILQIDRVHAETVDCVSPVVAWEMAQGVNRLFAAQIGLATTGYAEPPAQSPEAGSFAYFAISDTSSDTGTPVRSGKITCSDPNRTRTQQYFADYVLDQLADYLGLREALKAELSTSKVYAERLHSGGYRIGGVVVDEISALDGAVEAIKRPVAVIALRMQNEFEVLTGGESMSGRRGDWLLRGVLGELYVCPDEAFKQSYELSNRLLR